MASYKVPATADKRIKDFDALVDEFKREYSFLTEKQKKVSGYRSRKALLSIAKLTRYIRKDIQEYLLIMSGKQEKKDEVTKEVVEKVQPMSEPLVAETLEENLNV